MKNIDERISNLRERSKNDREIIVGSEIRELCKAADDARFALKILYEETADYIRINNLGDVHHNLSMQNARNALYGEKIVGG